MDEPSWLGNTQAAVLAALIFSPFTVWRRYSWWVRGACLLGCLFAVTVVGHHTIKGNLGTLVPPFVFTQVPGWALMVAFAVGVLAGGGLVRFASRPAQEPPPAPSARELPTFLPSDEAPPPPTSEAGGDPQEELWRNLNENEREVLKKLWSLTGQSLFLFECEDWPRRWGVPEWNAVLHHLNELGLIGEGRRRPPHASSRLLLLKTINLTTNGATLMTWYSRREAEPAPPIPADLNTPAATIRYGLMWPEIGPMERELLGLLWAQPETFASDALVESLQRKWGTPAFNAVIHSLRGMKLIDHWNRAQGGWGWHLTGAGRDLMTWREKQPKT